MHNNNKMSIINFMVKRHNITIEDFVFYLVHKNYSYFYKSGNHTEMFFHVLDTVKSCFYYAVNRINELNKLHNK